MTKDAYIRCESRTNHAVLARFASIRRLSTPLSLVRINSTILKLTRMGLAPVLARSVSLGCPAPSLPRLPHLRNAFLSASKYCSTNVGKR